MKFKEHLQIAKRAFGWYFKLSKSHTVCIIAASVLSSLVGYIPIYFSAKLIDALVANESISVLVLYAALTVGLVFIVQAAITFLDSVAGAISNDINVAEKWRFAEKAMQMAYESIEDSEVMHKLYRIKKENQTGMNLFMVQSVIKRFSYQITRVFASLALSASFFAIPSLAIYYKLALVAGLFVTLVITIKMTAKSARADNDFWASSVGANIVGERFSNYINDYSAGKDIRLYGMKDFLADGYYSFDSEYYKKYVDCNNRKALFSVPPLLAENLLKYGIYALLIFSALMGEVSVGEIAKYVSCLMLLISSVNELTSIVQRAFNNHHYLKRYFEYFDIPNNMYKGTLTVEKRDDNEYFVEFKNVSFKYPNTEEYALKNINLKFKVGERLAIVGMNGSGKTTFIKLLCRLYDPTEGEILLNGVNIQKYDYDEYMSIFSVVFQDFKLFPFKLGEVVASSRHFDSEKVNECLDKANFTGRSETLPNGVDTYLYKFYEDSGIEISGGEAQKIALARALYKDAPFILLDEPTAALDPVSEYEVYKNFNNISGDKTAVYISHRLASCRFCDKIAVFDHGQIVQTGSHDELVSDESGKYHALWHAQAQYYTK